MKNSGNNLQLAKLVYIFTLMPALLLLSTDSAAQSITNPRMRGMSSMQDHPGHPQSQQTRPSSDVHKGCHFAN